MIAGGVNLGDFPLMVGSENGTLTAALVVSDGDALPVDPTNPPTYRIYGEGPGPITNGTGSLEKLDTGTITAASLATPIVITSADHGLQTGDKVTITGVLGNTSANGDFTVTVINGDTFSLQGSSGNGAYTTGGLWHVSGLYQIDHTLLGGDGFASGGNYYVLVTWIISSVPYSVVCPFRVV